MQTAVRARVAGKPGAPSEEEPQRTGPRPERPSRPATGKEAWESQATRARPRTRPHARSLVTGTPTAVSTATCAQSTLPHVAPGSPTPTGHRGHGQSRAGGRCCPRRQCSESCLRPSQEVYSTRPLISDARLKLSLS